MYRQFNIQQFYVLPTQCIYVFCVHLRTTVIKTSQLMMYKAKVAVCSDIHTKHSTQNEHHIQFLNVKLWWYVKKPLGFKRLTNTSLNAWHDLRSTSTHNVRQGKTVTRQANIQSCYKTYSNVLWLRQLPSGSFCVRASVVESNIVSWPSNDTT